MLRMLSNQVMVQLDLRRENAAITRSLAQRKSQMAELTERLQQQETIINELKTRVN